MTTTALYATPMMVGTEQHELCVGGLAVRLARRLPAQAALFQCAAPALEEDTTGLDLWVPATRLCVGWLQSSAAASVVGGARVMELGAGLGAGACHPAALRSSLSPTHTHLSDDERLTRQ
jgi:hypothetical protein